MHAVAITQAIAVASRHAVTLAHEALVLGGEVVVGEALLVQGGPRLVQLGLGALGARLALGAIGIGKALLGDLAVGAGDFLTATVDLALARPRAHARQRRRRPAR